MNDKKELFIYNTLKNKKEKFIPLDESNVRMYACGPTVYNFAHLGNARAAITYDILFRTLRMIYGDDNVTYVSNITDVDDKIIKSAKENNISIRELSEKFERYYLEDMEFINNLRPTKTPRATENIDEMIKMIESLIENDYAYISNGHVLFDVNKYEKYGSLSKRSLEDLISGSRIEVANYKKNPLDFVLWKPAKTEDDDSSVFDSPWGRGRPGWHIECSAMSTKYLGRNYDIHGGGVDLKFPHHENEIAQSVCAYKGSQYARYWVHNGFLMVNGEKMSKSLGNFTTIRDLKKEGILGVVVRLSFLLSHYRKPMDFSKKVLEESENILSKFYEGIENVVVNEKEKQEAEEEVLTALCDDLNTPVAISKLHKLKQEKKFGQLKYALKILGLYDDKFLLNIKNKRSEKIKNLNLSAEEIEEKIKLRNKAKENKDWVEADRIRDELKKNGIVLKDSKNGSSWEIL